MIKIHDKLWVVKRTSSDVNLAYMTYYEKNAACEKRQATGRSWGGIGGTEEATYDNSPQEGIKIAGSVSRWSTSNKLFRVEDPRGFTVEIPTSNLSALLQCTTVTNGVVMEPCVWGREGSNHILLPVGSEPYLKSKADTKAVKEMVSFAKLTRGDVVKLDVESSSEYIFLGRAKVIWDVEVRQLESKLDSTSYSSWYYGSNYKPSNLETDSILKTFEVKDQKWCYLFKQDHKSPAYELKLQGKCVKLDKTSDNLDTKGVSLWMPERVETQASKISGVSYSYGSNQDGRYLNKTIKDIEWKV